MAGATEDPVIRHATREDVPLILDLIHALALYEREPDSVLATEASLLSTLTFAPFPSDGPVSGGYARTLLLFTPGPKPQPAGMALYFYNYSTWRGRPGIYLEDLFIKEEFRGRGYGTRLFEELAKEVKRIDGGRLEWSVLRWNEPSIQFYKSLGGQPLDEWMTMRVDGGALDALAKGKEAAASSSA